MRLIGQLLNMLHSVNYLLISRLFLFLFDFFLCQVTIYIDLLHTYNFAEYRQVEGGGAAKGWAVFGVLSCMYAKSNFSSSNSFLVFKCSYIWALDHM